MKSKDLIKTDVDTIDLYAAVSLARKKIEANEALVVLDNGLPIGILSSHDLAVKHCTLVVECFSSKPKINDANIDLVDVLKQMKISNSDALPVYDNLGHFKGLIQKNDVVDFLCLQSNEQKMVLQAAAHDLRSPIASIQSLNQLLDKQSQLKEIPELLDFLNQICIYANSIIDEILVMEELNEHRLTFAYIAIDELLLKCLQDFQYDATLNHITLSSDLKSDVNHIYIDRTSITRVIHNLLSNALKFTPKGGAVTLRSYSESQMLIIEITDTGIGIARDMVPVLFDKYTKAKRNGINGERSTGLGLYLVKKEIDLHAGEVEVYSQEGAGTTFKLRLPINR